MYVTCCCWSERFHHESICFKRAHAGEALAATTDLAGAAGICQLTGIVSIGNAICMASAAVVRSMSSKPIETQLGIR
jgi:hypothetical protein